MKLPGFASGIPIGLAVWLCLAPARVARAEDDAHIGTWELNLAKSTFDPGPAPRKQTMWYKAEGRELTALLQGIDANGLPISPDVSNLTIYFDGRDHPTARPGYDTSAWTRLSSHKYIVSRKKAGKVVQTSVNVVSDDGRTMTITTTGSAENERPMHNVRVYDRR